MLTVNALPPGYETWMRRRIAGDVALAWRDAELRRDSAAYEVIPKSSLDASPAGYVVSGVSLDLLPEMVMAPPDATGTAT